MFWKTVDVADTERAVVYSKHRLLTVLAPGRYRFGFWCYPLVLQKYSITQSVVMDVCVPLFEKRFRFLFSEYCEFHSLRPTEIALVYQGDTLIALVPPGKTFMIWKEGNLSRVVKIDLIQGLVIEPTLLSTLKSLNTALQGYETLVQCVRVDEGHVGLLKIDGKIVDCLPPGAHGFWRGWQTIEVVMQDMRLQNSHGVLPKLLTKEGERIDVVWSIVFCAVDARKARTKVQDPDQWVANWVPILLSQRLADTPNTQLLERHEALQNLFEQTLKLALKKLGMSLNGVSVIIRPSASDQAAAAIEPSHRSVASV